MKQFLIKISVFSIFYLIIIQIVSSFKSYHWGNPWYSTKIQYLESENTKVPNTYFFGSSRIYRQINPSTFDSIHNVVSSDKRQSFNLGAPATFCPQTYYLYDNFIESEIAKNVDLVFMELMPVNIISERLMLQERTTYWQNTSDLKFVFKSFRYNTTFTLKEKYKAIKDYSTCYIYNLFDLHFIKQKLFNENKINTAFLGPYKNGYYSLDYQLGVEKDSVIKKDLIHRRNVFITDSFEMRKRLLDLRDYHDSKYNNFDVINLERISKLIDRAREQGIDLIFVIPQIIHDKNLISLSREIPSKNLIDLSDPKKFPQLYATENIFDLGHLNSNGAEVFTELLVKEYLKIK